MSPSGFASLLTGKGRVSKTLLLAIQQVHGYNPEWILTGEGKKKGADFNTPRNQMILSLFAPLDDQVLADMARNVLLRENVEDIMDIISGLFRQRQQREKECLKAIEYFSGEKAPEPTPLPPLGSLFDDVQPAPPEEPVNFRKKEKRGRKKKNQESRETPLVRTTDPEDMADPELIGPIEREFRERMCRSRGDDLWILP